MSMKVIGRGDKLVARVLELEYGSKEKPWLSDDAGMWPIEAFRLKVEAQRAAGRFNAEEDERAEAVNRKRARQRKPPIQLLRRLCGREVRPMGGIKKLA
jgi:hypothetical protein